MIVIHTRWSYLQLHLPLSYFYKLNVQHKHQGINLIYPFLKLGFDYSILHKSHYYQYPMMKNYDINKSLMIDEDKHDEICEMCHAITERYAGQEDELGEIAVVKDCPCTYFEYYYRNVRQVKNKKVHPDYVYRFATKIIKRWRRDHPEEA